MKLTFEDIEKHVDQRTHSLNLTRGEVLYWRSETSDDFRLICQFLKDNPSITEFTNYGKVGNKIVAENATALATITTLSSLYLRSNLFGVEGAKAFALSNSITTLDVSRNAIGDEGAIALAMNTTLTNLNVGDNNIGIEGVKALAASSTLTTLSIWSNNIHTEGAKEYEKTIPNEVMAILVELRVLQKKLTKTLHIPSLPHYGIDELSTITEKEVNKIKN